MSDITNPNTQIANVDDLINKANQVSLILGIRIVQPQNELLNPPNEKRFQIGDWCLGQENLGNSLNVLIGPWRCAARQFINNGLATESYNFAAGAKFNFETNNWEFPYNYTPKFEEMARRAQSEKGNPANATLVGRDILFYDLDRKSYYSYFIARTAESMTNVRKTCQVNPNRRAILTTIKAPSNKFNWYLPEIRLAVESVPHAWDNDILHLFLNPVEDSLTQSNERPR